MSGSTNSSCNSTSSSFDSQSVFGQMSTPFGVQTGASGNSSSSSFDPQSVYGHMSSAARKQFAPKPFGSPNPSVAHTGDSIFGGTLSGMSGQPSLPLFGASSAPAFGFGPAVFVDPSSSFSGAPTSTQASGIPGFGQQPAGGTRIASYSPTTPVEKLESISAMPQYKDKSHEELRWEDYHGGDKGSSFGKSSTRAFGSTPIGASATSVFRASSTPAFCSSKVLTVGSPTVPACGAPSTFSFSFGPSHSTIFGATATSSHFGGQSSSYGAPASTLAFGSPCFGQLLYGGTRIAPYAPTTEVDGGSGIQPAEKLESISAMPWYKKDKSHEELRWEYYHGDKGSSLFVKKPAFGGFGSLPSQSIPFSNSTFQPIQSAFGSGSVFYSTSPFGASSQPAFGASSTPTSGSTSTPAFGATSTPAFGAASTPAFGAASTPEFGSTSPSIFGNTGSSFGVSSSPAFGSTPFEVSTTPVYGVSSTPAFGASTALTLGSPTVPAFGASNTSSFSFGSTPSFGQSNSTFSSTTLGSISSPFAGRSSVFGAPTSTPAYGIPGFGQPPAGGSRIAPFSSTTEVDWGSGTQPGEKIESISAMPQYKDKSHEELRWEDYQCGDKGAPTSTPVYGIPGFGQPPAGGSRIAPFSSTTEVDWGSGTQPAVKIESISAMPQYKDTSHEELRWEDYQCGDKGGPNPSGQVPVGASFTTAQPNHFWTGTFSQPVGNPFSPSSSADPFAMKSSGLASSSGFGGPNPSGQVPTGVTFTTAPPNHCWTGTFGQPVGNPFSPPPYADPFAMKSSGLASSSGLGSSSIFSSSLSGASFNPFGSTMSTPPFGSSTNAFGSTSTPLFGVTISSTSSAPSFLSSTLPGSSSSFGRGLTFWITEPAGLFQSCTPSFGQTTPAFGQPNKGFQQTTSAFGPSPFNLPTAFTGGVFSSSTLPTFSSSNAVGFSQPPAPNCLSLVQVSLAILHL